jgi:hypothetical protein
MRIAEQWLSQSIKPMPRSSPRLVILLGWCMAVFLTQERANLTKPSSSGSNANAMSVPDQFNYVLVELFVEPWGWGHRWDPISWYAVADKVC